MWGAEYKLFNAFFIFVRSISDDHSRVRLQTLEGDVNSDYINGNYIDVCIFIETTNVILFEEKHGLFIGYLA